MRASPALTPPVAQSKTSYTIMTFTTLSWHPLRPSVSPITDYIACPIPRNDPHDPAQSTTRPQSGRLSCLYISIILLRCELPTGAMATATSFDKHNDPQLTQVDSTD